MSATTKRYAKCSVADCAANAHHDGSGRRGFCCMHYQRWQAHGDPLFVWKQERPAIEWLESRVLFTGDECLPWPFTVGKDGYGRVHRPDTYRLTTASRMMCEMAHGPAPSRKHEAAHSCGNGNKACTNPNHVYWATPTRNHADKVAHGTTNRGERQGSSKLTEADIRAIRSLCETMSNTDIARIYSLDQSTVSQIKGRKRWGWLA
jgi:hypothetical protein